MFNIGFQQVEKKTRLRFEKGWGKRIKPNKLYNTNCTLAESDGAGFQTGSRRLAVGLGWFGFKDKKSD